MALFVIATASVFGWLLAWEGFPWLMRDLLLSIGETSVIVELLIIATILLLGLFVEGIPVLIIFAPIFVLVVQSLGIDLVQFGVVFVVAVLIGSVTPPVGILLYIGCGIARIPVSRASGVIWPFVLVMVLVVVFLGFFQML
jgi:C4-dicarboxylate transporter DctM subunit